MWAQTKDGRAGRNAPEPFLFPWEQPPDLSMVGDAMTLDEARDWLKWDRELQSD